MTAGRGGENLTTRRGVEDDRQKVCKGAVPSVHANRRFNSCILMICFNSCIDTFDLFKKFDAFEKR